MGSKPDRQGDGLSSHEEGGITEISFIDENGVFGTIHNNLEIKSDEPVSPELRSFLEEIARNQDGTAPTLESLPSMFVIDLFVQTSVRKVEPGIAISRTEWAEKAIL